MDLKVAAVFASRTAAHALPSDSSSANPGPGAHSPISSFNAPRATIGARYDRTMRSMQMRSDGGAHTSFGTTALRFSDGTGYGEVRQPGPGAHTVSRWSGEQPSWRRIGGPHESGAHSAGSLQHFSQGGAFLSSSERFATDGRLACAPDVVSYLAHGPAQIGQPAHAQNAMRQVARGVVEARASAPLGLA